MPWVVHRKADPYICFSSSFLPSLLTILIAFTLASIFLVPSRGFQLSTTNAKAQQESYESDATKHTESQDFTFGLHVGS